jgi:hypothetical protein
VTHLTWRARSLYLYPPWIGWPSYASGTGFPSCLLLWLTGLQWRYSNPPRHGIYTVSLCDWQSVSMFWCRAPSGTRDQIFVKYLTAMILSYSGALSDERLGLSFITHSLKSLLICMCVCIYIYIKDFACLTRVINTIYTSPSSVQARYSSTPGLWVMSFL